MWQNQAAALPRRKWELEVGGAAERRSSGRRPDGHHFHFAPSLSLARQRVTAKNAKLREDWRR